MLLLHLGHELANLVKTKSGWFTFYARLFPVECRVSHHLSKQRLGLESVHLILDLC
jgi:hypothetical protein